MDALDEGAVVKPVVGDDGHAAERLRTLWEQVDKLPEEEQQLIHLHFGQRLTLVESAEVMAMPLSTLKLRLRSALDRLRLRLKEFSGDFANTNP